MKFYEVIIMILLSPFILVAFIVALPFMAIRALCLKPQPQQQASVEEKTFDEQLLTEHLSQAITYPTISMTNEYEGMDKPFFDYHAFLERTYPLIHKTAQKTIINKYSLVYLFKGKDSSLKPAAFLAHQDVVPAPVEGWECDPFGGVVKDGFIYGRGTQDMKGTQIALMEGMEKLLRDGYVPNRDIYFCFGHDEETFTTDGALKIAEWLDEQNIKLEFVVDEGGIIVDRSVLSAVGLKNEIGLIATSEKGHTNLRLTIRKQGGHASNPSKPSAAVELSKALIKLENNPMPPVWTKTMKELFTHLAPHFPFYIKLFLANRALLSPLLKYVFKKIPLANSLIATTFAITKLKGSNAENVIPPSVEANVNCRIITGTSVEEVKQYVQKLLGDKVEVDTWDSTEPTKDSPTDNDIYKNLCSAINQAFPGMITAPYMFIANDDARYYQSVCDNIYRFTPFVMNLEDQERIHALNERVTTKSMVQASQFFAYAIEIMC